MATLTAERSLLLPRPPRRVLAAGVLVIWVALAAVLSGRDTLTLGSADVTWLHGRLNDLRDAADAGRNSNPFFIYVVNEIRVAVDALVRAVQALIAQPSGGRPVPEIGWLGVVAIGSYLAAALGNLRVAVLSALGLTFLGLQGLWQESMDTLALTLSAVALAVVIGVPIGIAAGVDDRVDRLFTPLLDVAQTLPTFVYLAPLTLLFLIGPASATITTLIYAIPPVIRLTLHGIRAVPSSSVEASTSLGATSWQRLRHVLLPMARPTIVVGVNQTIMAALSMATITALIDAPGLGKTVLKALETQDVGSAFNAGLAIVVLAIVLDRVTTAAAGRSGQIPRRTPRATRVRWTALVAGAVATASSVQLSRTYLWAAQFPSDSAPGGVDLNLGNDIARVSGQASQWVQDNAYTQTSALKDGVTSLLVDPLQALLAGSPWWLVAASVVALAAIAAGVRAAGTAIVCLGLLVGTGLWSDAMTTLASTLVATVAVMVLGVTFGVWMGRSARVDQLLRPLLDAGQTMPAFVYLVPFVALFAASRFTAIVAAVLYAAPVAIKIVADGVRAVSATTVEAATAAGSSSWQLITKVQLPMSSKALTLALNQGLIYVLSMVVVGGLVGAGALGYDVVAGFSQGQLYGKGLAAGAAIVLLGIMLDRVTQAAARRTGGSSQRRTT
ncbi:MAG TPA: ABC transporter permease subunit [Kineosporiaceae bacterium]|nr:ABC transporter permease subunit [Kineosporiaceae bacterium]